MRFQASKHVSLPQEWIRGATDHPVQVMLHSRRVPAELQQASSSVHPKSVQSPDSQVKLEFTLTSQPLRGSKSGTESHTTTFIVWSRDPVKMVGSVR